MRATVILYYEFQGARRGGGNVSNYTYCHPQDRLFPVATFTLTPKLEIRSAWGLFMHSWTLSFSAINKQNMQGLKSGDRVGHNQ